MAEVRQRWPADLGGGKGRLALGKEKARLHEAEAHEPVRRECNLAPWR